MWTEFLPTQTQPNIVTGVPIKPGDNVWVVVSISDPNRSGPVVFTLYNISAKVLTSFKNDNNTTISGDTVEWILERPLQNGNLPALSNYGTAVIHRSDNARLQPGGSYSRITMVNDLSQPFSTATGLPGATATGLIVLDIDFNWNNFL
jgi:hypothetical protein